MNSILKKHLFVIITFCLALSWQTSHLVIFSSNIQINFLLFALFYFSYSQDEADSLILYVFFFGTMYDILNQNPLFVTPFSMLSIRFILCYLIKTHDIAKTTIFQCILFFATMTSYNVIFSIMSTVFGSAGQILSLIHISEPTRPY